MTGRPKKRSDLKPSPGRPGRGSGPAAGAAKSTIQRARRAAAVAADKGLALNEAMLKDKIARRNKEKLVAAAVLLQKGTIGNMTRKLNVGYPAVSRYVADFAGMDQQQLAKIHDTAQTLLSLDPSSPPRQPTARPTCLEAANAQFGAPAGNLDKKRTYQRGWEEAWVLLHKMKYHVREVQTALQQRYGGAAGLPSRTTLFEILKSSAETPKRRGAPSQYPREWV